MIACLDWSGAGEGSGSGRGAGKSLAKGGKSAKGGKVPKVPEAPKVPKGGGAAHDPAPAKPGDQALVPTGGGLSAHSAGQSMDRSGGPLPFLVAPGAPDLDLHRPELPESEVQSVFARKRALREERIARIVADAEREGRPSERIVAAIIHDSEQAPESTNRAQLEEIGVRCPPGGLQGVASLAALGDAEVHRRLCNVIYGLAYLGIYLSGTDHLDDRALLSLLAGKIIDERIRDVPPSSDMSEFIDVSPCRAEDVDGPDGLQGPFDIEDEEDDGSEPLRARSGKGTRSSRAGRDALLPRPARPGLPS